MKQRSPVNLPFPSPLVEGRLVQRYKRFLCDVDLRGRVITAHCPNTGSMRGCAEPGSAVLLSRSDNPRRKLAHTLELVRVGRVWVGVNTLRPNALARLAIKRGAIPELAGYDDLRSEARTGDSRIDLLLTGSPRRCWVEVKNVTMARGRVALFPDAVTARGRKHLVELARCVRAGDRATQFFVVNRGDCTEMRPAKDIDPAYAAALSEAQAAGVRLLAYRFRSTRRGTRLEDRLPVLL